MQQLRLIGGRSTCGRVRRLPHTTLGMRPHRGNVGDGRRRLRNSLHEGAICNFEEAGVISTRGTAAALSDVGGDRHRCASKLVCQTESSSVGRGFRDVVDVVGVIDRPLPHRELLKVEQSDVPGSQFSTLLSQLTSTSAGATTRSASRGPDQVGSSSFVAVQPWCMRVPVVAPSRTLPTRRTRPA